MAAREAYSRKGSAGPCLGPADESSSARSSRALRGTAVEGANEADGPLSSLYGTLTGRPGAPTVVFVVGDVPARAPAGSSRTRSFTRNAPSESEPSSSAAA